MSDVIYLRPMDPPITAEEVLRSVDYVDGCFNLHRVDWVHSFLSADGGRLMCWYQAPDAESARLALRDIGSDMRAVWPCRVLGGVAPQSPEVSRAGVLAEVSLGDGYDGGDDEIERRLGLGDDDSACRFAFLTNRRDRLICLLEGEAPDGARDFLGQAGLVPADAWSCTVVTP